MKFLIKCTGVLLMVVMLASCIAPPHPRSRPMPPGHAKKIYGGSARYYAPGQVKKRVYYYDNGHAGHKRHKGHKRHH
ncbi:hypothetical protein K0U91_13895 [Chryseobacterium chendengshani]|uniref:hypothetical protein n=1 Tax=Chryseobacterium sp. LJ668 TaxID=2864040 RepID=UPI001C68DFBE|nr:hypothetical protein [Chryseobacterium sp. LJ668]MBW8522598.1 hypothetical protein [Chryseobacterium sp. LJ668]QYK16135.1 hypothetical protein K0U91_13895 [Chryseobacterium sp. LJ668]